ncbi:MAG: C1 family peptidase [Anaerolineae bacterium]
MVKTIDGLGMGWLPDYPDFRDYTVDQMEVPTVHQRATHKDPIKAMLKEVGVADLETVKLNKSADLRRWCSPIEDQESLGSCTAQAAAAVVEYFERRAFGESIDVSRLFIYKVSRNMLGWTGDTGAYLRTTMGALVLFGAPPEEYWPYDIDNFDQEPSAFCYSYARNYQAISYYRLDPPTIRRDQLLKRVKANLGSGLPSMFGFTVYSSIGQAAETGKVPYPSFGERRLGGHAVVAVGFDDDMEIENQDAAEVTTGALLIRNSWGEGWGEDGYGWLPYKYVLESQAIDWWSLLRNEWIETKAFRL